MRNKVIVRILGGIGNQLFCYSAARRLAVVNGAELIIDDSSGFSRDFEYRRRYQLEHFRIPCRRADRSELLKPFARARRYLKRAVNRRRSFQERTYIQQEGFDFDARLLRFKPHGTVYLEGYWQSEEYFRDIESTIRSDLTFVPPNDPINIAMAARMSDSLAVAVHVRFFDEPGGPGVNNAPAAYYVRALAAMEDLAPGAHYFVFSDRPDAARATLRLPDSRVTCVVHNTGDARAYADLWLMTHAAHFIIANSTFSWWGAWLAEGEGKHVIAPGFVMREGKMWWGFKGLLPERWIKL